MDSESEIWEYTSLKRSRRVNSSSSSNASGRKPSKRARKEVGSATKGRRKVSQGVKLSGSHMKTKHSKKKQPLTGTPASGTNGSAVTSSLAKTLDDSTTTPNKKTNEGYCPNCQMPFSILIGKSPGWHVTDCLDKVSNCNKECPDGLLCSSAFPSHYSHFSHYILAAHRAGQDVGNVPEFSIEQCNGSDMTESASTVDVTRDNGGNSKSARRLFFQNVSEKCEPDDDPEDNKSDVHDSDEDIFAPLEAWPKSDVECMPPQRASTNVDENCPRSSCASKTFHGLDDGPTRDLNAGKDDTQETKAFTQETVELPETNQHEDVNYEGVEEDVDIDDILSVCSEVEPETESQSLDSKSYTDGHGQSTNKTDMVDRKSDETYSFESEDKDDVSTEANNTAFGNKLSRSPLNAHQTNITSFFKPKGGCTKVKPKPQSTIKQIDSSQSTDRKTKWNVNEASYSSKWKRNDNSNQGSSSNSRSFYSKKNCPFYKKIPGTPFTVDAFRYGDIADCKAYFLSHFHYDHYGGLTKHFKNPIYCSKVTGNLVKSKIKVAAEYVHCLPLNVSCQVEGVQVTLLEANHCPGAVLILFTLADGRNILHTGDFRADPSMEEYPELKGKHIHQLYLDTTYCDPAYKFPPQNDTIEFAVSIAVKAVMSNPRTLIVCGSYSIGKERIFLAVAEALDCKVCVTREKKTILDCLEDQHIKNLLTLNGNDTNLHVITMSQLNPKSLYAYLNKFKHKYDSVLAFKPTGWTHSERCSSLSEIKPTKSGVITVYGVPYSEHSSYSELKRFVQFLKPEKILPTVNNGNAQSRKKMEALFAEWMQPERKPLQGRARSFFK
ncbi:uncharacterized protein [Ptychodera flava]|uniref:uncharacterized protein n=1 Tax=Ptychodera flava TaxID=63121 RepID=UPI003969D620